MSNKSNDHGRAYEFITLITLFEEISAIRQAKIDENSSFFAAQSAWKTLSSEEQAEYKASARVAIKKIFELEPRILEDGNDLLELLIQPDQKGQEGDVRDILIIRRNITWEIGLSLKHDHQAVKHSRLAHQLDFGKSWYGIPCSEQYWKDVQPIFEYLSTAKQNNKKFSELPNKVSDVYNPLVRAFIDEVKRQYDTHADLPRKIVEYLVGKYDFYKVISEDKLKSTLIEGYNLYGTLGQSGIHSTAAITIPVTTLPTRIIKLDFIPGSLSTAELYMDGGWQFTFRIHNAKTMVEPSLKFDVQTIGMPVTILLLRCNRKDAETK
jgi:hypothetical protein